MPEQAVADTPDPLPWKQFALLVIGLFAVYNANFRAIGPLDPIPATLLPSSLLLDADTDLSEFRTLLEGTDRYEATIALGTLQERDGRLVSSYPLGAALVALPLYAIPVWMGWLEDWRDFELLGKLSASLIVALSAGFLFLAAAEIAGSGPALLLALAYGLATDAWAVASQALWQHGPGMLCLAVGLFLVLRLERGQGSRVALGAGAALALAVLCRSLNVIPAGALGLFVLVRHRRHVILFAAPLVCAGVWQAWYNLATYENLSGGYDAIIGSKWHGWRGLTSETLFTYPFWQGLGGLLLSPGKGLFFYTPYMIFAAAALIPAAFSRDFPLGRYLALWVCAVLVPLSKNALWWGGSSYGPRYLSEALLPLTLVLAWLWPKLLARPWTLPILAASVAASFLIQIVGAFFAPCDWHETPVYVDHRPERLWDWSDTQIARCLVVGISQGPHPFVFLEAE